MAVEMGMLEKQEGGTGWTLSSSVGHCKNFISGMDALVAQSTSAWYLQYQEFHLWGSQWIVLNNAQIVTWKGLPGHLALQRPKCRVQV